MNRRQAARLRRLSEYLRRTERKFMLELLVPPETDELVDLGGNAALFDRAERRIRRSEIQTADRHGSFLSEASVYNITAPSIHLNLGPTRMGDPGKGASRSTDQFLCLFLASAG